MTRTRLLIPLCLALMLGAVPLFAQTEQPAPVEPAAAPANDTKQKTPAPQSSAENTKQNSGAGQNAKKRPDSGSDSPFDYRASEEISEDLPVSFPADI